MERRLLGQSELQVAPFAFGGNVFGWTVDERTAFKLLDRYVQAGGNFIDTADIYPAWVKGNQGGESETIIGNWFKASGKRSKVLIATKVGIEMGPAKKGLSKNYIINAVEDSLRRLQTDYIDLYQAHQDDKTVPLEETLEAFTYLIQQGKVRAIGASNLSPERLTQALETSKKQGLCRYQSLQTLYNLYDRLDYESKLEPICIKNGLGVLTYFSLASGFLSGKYRSEKDLAKSARGPAVKKYLNEKGFRILNALDYLADHYHISPTQVAFAWIMSRPSVTSAIASATSIEQLDELIEATEVRLNHAAMLRLEEASSELVA